MGVRHSVDMTFQVGLGSSLSPALFSGEFSQLLDSLARAEAGTYSIAPGEQNVQVDFGDVAQAREVTLGGSVGTVGTLLGVGGTFPTAFVGGEAFGFTIDGTAVTGTFQAGDQTAQQCVNRLNAAAMLAGLDYVPFVIEAGQIRVSGSDASASGAVSVTTANATLGFPTTTSDSGTDPLAGSAPIQLRRPIDPNAESAEDVKVFALLSAMTGSITITSLEVQRTTTARVAIAGDVL
jgi:hypothetical protein